MAWVRPDDNKNHDDIDLGIAVEHLCLAAADRGLGSCWVCNYDFEAVNQLSQLNTTRLWLSFPTVALFLLVHFRRRNVKI